jgi:hypothetical protein
LGALGSARAGAGVAAFVIGGVLGTFIGWRPAFGILIVLSAVVFLLSFRLKPDHGRPDVRIDGVGVVLAAAAIILISFGFNNLNRWGLGVARPGAPFDIFGLSPAPPMIVIGIALGQAFLNGRGGVRRQARRRSLHFRSSSRARSELLSMRCSRSSRSKVRSISWYRSISRSCRAARHWIPRSR